MGPATFSAASLSYKISTNFKENSRVVPGPLLVTTLPSTTTLSSTFVLSVNFSVKFGWHVAFSPSNSPWCYFIYE